MTADKLLADSKHFLQEHIRELDDDQISLQGILPEIKKYVVNKIDSHLGNSKSKKVLNSKNIDNDQLYNKTANSDIELLVEMINHLMSYVSQDRLQGLFLKQWKMWAKKKKQEQKDPSEMG